MNWLTKIPVGSHGSNPTQKRYWRVVSDIVRIRDWYKYKTCIACGKFIVNWQDLQAGHYKSWSACRGYSKWDMLNIFGECPSCNTGFNGNETGAKFRDGIIDRYGKERMKYIDSLSSYPTEKMDNCLIEIKIKDALKIMGTLPEQPEYYEKVMKYLS